MDRNNNRKNTDENPLVITRSACMTMLPSAILVEQSLQNDLNEAEHDILLLLKQLKRLQNENLALVKRNEKLERKLLSYKSENRQLRLKYQQHEEGEEEAIKHSDGMTSSQQHHHHREEDYHIDCPVYTITKREGICNFKGRPTGTVIIPVAATSQNRISFSQPPNSLHRTGLSKSDPLVYDAKRTKDGKEDITFGRNEGSATAKRMHGSTRDVVEITTDSSETSGLDHGSINNTGTPVIRRKGTPTLPRNHPVHCNNSLTMTAITHPLLSTRRRENGDYTHYNYHNHGDEADDDSVGSLFLSFVDLQ